MGLNQLASLGIILRGFSFGFVALLRAYDSIDAWSQTNLYVASIQPWTKSCVVLSACRVCVCRVFQFSDVISLWCTA